MATRRNEDRGKSGAEGSDRKDFQQGQRLPSSAAARTAVIDVVFGVARIRYAF
jgi:hypothetical protein